MNKQTGTVTIVKKGMLTVTHILLAINIDSYLNH